MNHDDYQEEWKQKDRQETKDLGILGAILLAILVVAAKYLTGY